MSEDGPNRRVMVSAIKKIVVAKYAVQDESATREHGDHTLIEHCHLELDSIGVQDLEEVFHDKCTPLETEPFVPELVRADRRADGVVADTTHLPVIDDTNSFSGVGHDHVKASATCGVGFPDCFR